MQSVPVWGRHMPTRVQESARAGRPTMSTPRGHRENEPQTDSTVPAAVADAIGGKAAKSRDAVGPENGLPHAGGNAPPLRA